MCACRVVSVWTCILYIFVMFECVKCVNFKALSRLCLVCPEGYEFSFVVCKPCWKVKMSKRGDLSQKASLGCIYTLCYDKSLGVTETYTLETITKNIFETVQRGEISQWGQCLKCYVYFTFLTETEAQHFCGKQRRDMFKLMGKMCRGLSPYQLKCTSFTLPVFSGIWFRQETQPQSICVLLHCFKGFDDVRDVSRAV